MPSSASSEAGGAPTTPRLDHGAIGNGRVLALVSPTSAIEWLCLPRFDSPSFFGRLLDARQGGWFGFTTRGDERPGRIEYLPNTNVLRTTFEDADSAWEVVDFAPRIPEGLSVRVPTEIVRVVRPLRGLPIVGVRFDPRPDFARVVPSITEANGVIEVRGGGQDVRLFTTAPVAAVLSGTPFALREPVHFLLSSTREHAPSHAEVLADLELTIAGWRAWSKTCALPSFAPHAVLRSALCLKLHAWHDTGAIIAAATTSIPEAMGTPRTWDYRYCWLRDAAFVVEALRRLSHLREGEQFLTYLLGVAESGPLQPLYGIGGERELGEEVLEHLAGFGGSGPVRVGNAAAVQRQNDLMGEMILCLESLLRDPRIVHERPETYHALVRRLVEEADAAASTLDTGIWEFRSLLRPYTFSRAMCHVALHRGARLARMFGWKEDAERWEARAEQERDETLRRGWSERHGYFTQALDGEHPDAVNLLLPTIGLVDAHDPRFLSTIDAYERLLTDRGLMLRYRNQDDFGSTTSAFTICSFWWAEALALAGRLDDAIQLFLRLQRYANPVGLFSEDIDPATGLLLGNFPQAYTHVGLVHAAVTIGECLDARDGRVRAWS